VALSAQPQHRPAKIMFGCVNDFPHAAQVFHVPLGHSFGVRGEDAVTALTDLMTKK
jgi:hypothetical protein